MAQAKFVRGWESSKADARQRLPIARFESEHYCAHAGVPQHAGHQPVARGAVA